LVARGGVKKTEQPQKKLLFLYKVHNRK